MKKILYISAAFALSMMFVMPVFAALPSNFGTDSYNPDLNNNPTGAGGDGVSTIQPLDGSVNGAVTKVGSVNGAKTTVGSVNGQNTAIPSLPNPLGDKIGTIPQLIYKVVKVRVDVSYIVIAFFLILSGFKFVTAQGSEDKLSNAKNTFKNTIIGAVLIIGAQVIVSVAQSIFASLK
jgi:hypothetical protein